MTDDLRDPEVLRALAVRIDALPSVARRSGGVLGTAAAYLPGERIEGLRVREGDRLEVHVVMRWGSTVDDVERDVFDVIHAHWDQTTVDLIIEDIAMTGVEGAAGAISARAADAGPRR